MSFAKIGNKSYIGNSSEQCLTKEKDFSYLGALKTPYYGITYFSAINNKYINIENFENLINKYKALLELHHKEGGLINSWWLNQDSDNSISKVKIEKSKKGSGAGLIEFAYLDTPIQAEDYFVVFLKGEVIYKGFVKNDVDISNPKVNLSGRYQRLKELLYSHDFSSYTDQLDILKNIIETIEADSGIHWNAEKIILDELEPIIIKYILEFPEKVIDQIISNNNNKYAGVDDNDDFYVKEDELTDIKHKLYNCDDAVFEKVDAEIDYSNIKATELAVSKKDDSASGSVFLDFVGDEGNVDYPPLEIRNKIRKIQDKIDVTEVLSDASALMFGYANLKKMAKPKQPKKITKIDIDKIFPEIGDRCLAEGEFQEDFLSINPCESISGWNNSSIAVAVGKDKTNCIKLFSSDYEAVSYLDLLEVKQWYKQKKIGFWIKNASADERYIEVGFTDDLGSVNYTKIYCRIQNVWEWYNIPVTAGFRYIAFKNTDLLEDNIYVDDIQVLCTHKKQYIDNVSLITLTFQSNKIDCDITLGDLTEEESDELFLLKRKIRILEQIKAI